MVRRFKLPRAAVGQSLLDDPSAQRRPMRMLKPYVLILADLPVDVVVVLEQQE